MGGPRSRTRARGVEGGDDGALEARAKASREDWAKRVERWKDSGLTAKDSGLTAAEYAAETWLEGYLDCGLLCRGFARLRCDGCAETRLVAFSCKGRG
ncbi:MAG: transposase zinc-binding domain-containing protein [Labilithrix sp.]|nr:transposase zinc-binding domain-containing protein [Labilithrix sp.]